MQEEIGQQLFKSEESASRWAYTNAAIGEHAKLRDLQSCKRMTAANWGIEFHGNDISQLQCGSWN